MNAKKAATSDAINVNKADQARDYSLTIVLVVYHRQAEKALTYCKEKEF